MRQFFRHCEIARLLYWRCRQLLGLAPKSDFELLYRFQRHEELIGADTPGVFVFPWGAFEFSAAGSVKIQYEEIFRKRHYAFTTATASPVIVDCGGNMGLSAVWFKLNYPACKLSVFEPDQNLAGLIENNLKAGGFSGFECIRKAAWVKDGTIGFDLRGDDRGRIDAAAFQSVESVDLARWLPGLVDLLKLDIEGAEYEVIKHLCHTGAIHRVKNLVCELHVVRGTEVNMVSTLQKLKDTGMHMSMNYGAAVSGIGLSDEIAPFEVIGRNHFLIELYAWWPDKNFTR